MTNLEPKSPQASRIRLTQLMGPDSANIVGNVHGGVLMKLCDEAGAMAATKHARHVSVTVIFDEMTFSAPVKIGEIVTFDASVAWVGRTSMETVVTVTAENVITGEVCHTNKAYIVYVALDDDRRPTAVPALTLVTEKEKCLHAAAAKRQAYRLSQRNGGAHDEC